MTMKEFVEEYMPTSKEEADKMSDELRESPGVEAVSTRSVEKGCMGVFLTMDPVQTLAMMAVMFNMGVAWQKKRLEEAEVDNVLLKLESELE